MANLLQEIRERLNSPERIEIEENRASIFAWNIVPSDQIIRSLTPAIADLDQFRSEDDRPTNISEFTASLWIQKSEMSPAFNQVQLVGGEIKNEESAKAAIRELAEEGHIYGINTDMLKSLGKRKYKIDHDNYRSDEIGNHNRKARVTKKDEVFITQTPSLITAQSFDAKDKIKRFLYFTPGKVDELFTENKVYLSEYNEWVLLQDSLSTNELIRQRQNVQSSPEIDQAIKDTALYHAYYFEAETTLKIISKLREYSPSIGHARYLDRELEKIISRFQAINSGQLRSVREEGFTTDLVLLRKLAVDSKKYFFKFESQLTTQDIDLTSADDVLPAEVIEAINHLNGFKPKQERALKKRVHLLREIRQAYQAVEFEENLKFIERSGPQAAFLAAQNLLQMNKLTNNEYRLINEKLPEIALFLNLLLFTFEVSPEQENWYEELILKMHQYAIGKILYIEGEEEKADFTEQKTTRNLLETTFAYNLGIEPEQIIEYIDNANNFSAYIDKPLESSADPLLRSQLYNYIQGRITREFDELLMRAFGVVIAGRPKTTLTDRWISWKTLIMTIRNVETDMVRNFNESPDAERIFNHIFNDHLVDKVLTQQAELHIPGHLPWGRYQLQESLEIKNLEIRLPGLVKPLQINLDGIIPELLSIKRPKLPNSITRKNMERGPINWVDQPDINGQKKIRYIDHIDQGWDIQDYYGRMIVIDTDKFWHDVLEKNSWLKVLPFKEHQKKQIIQAWSHEVIKQIINCYEKKAVEFNFEYERVKPRLSKYLMDVYPHEKYFGSGSSKANLGNENWAWVKFAHIVIPRPGYHTDMDPNVQIDEELQIFPSIEDAKIKITDDARYDRDRLLTAHREGYFPLMFVLYYLHPVYPEITKKLRQEGTIFPGPPRENVLRKISKKLAF